MNPSGKHPVLSLMFLVLLLGAACSLTGGKTPTAQPPAGGEGALIPPTQASEAQLPAAGAAANLQGASGAVFRLIAKVPYADPKKGSQETSIWGTGFFIAPDGLAVTTNSKVNSAALIEVYLDGETEARKATVVAVSDCSDLAVIRVEGGPYPFLEWYTGEVQPGMHVYAAGFASGTIQYSLTDGIISKTDADGSSTWSDVPYLYGHTAKIDGYGLGGPLLSEDGQVVGVNIRVYSNSDQQFALPAALAVPELPALTSGLGVASLGLYSYFARIGPNEDMGGMWVERVTTGGPADLAGVRPGDHITRVEGIDASPSGTARELCSILRAKAPGDPLRVQVYRSATGETLEGTIYGTPLAVTGAGSQGTGGGAPAGNNATASSSGVSDPFDGDFTATGWVMDTNARNPRDYTLNPKPGRLEVMLLTADTYLALIHPGFNGTDMVVRSNFTKISGPNEMRTGVVCRYSPAGTYVFTLTNGGLWKIHKVVGGKLMRIDEGATAAIRVANKENAIEARCIGTKLTLYINGIFVAEAVDEDLTAGQAGLYLQSLEMKEPEVQFDAFSVQAP